MLVEAGRMLRSASGPLATCASALLFGWAFPPTGWSALGWVALAPFFVALRRAGSLRATLLLTWLWCLVAAWVVGEWFPRSVSEYFEQPLALGVAFFFGVFTLMAGPYYLGFALAYRALARRFVWAMPFLAAAAWTAAELGRGRFLTGTPFFIGNPWGLLGYSQVEELALAQIASVTGVYGVSFAAACVGAGLAEAGLRAARRELSVPHALLLAALAGLPLAAAGLWGSWVLRNSASEAGARPIPIALAQGDVDVGTRWSSDQYGRNLDVYLELTLEALERGRPEAIFWPESALTFMLEDEPLYRAAIARVLRHGDVELVVGGPRSEPGEEPRYWNSVFALSQGGTITARYDKQYLVPFAEYFPLRIDVMRRRFGRIREFAHGTSAQPLATRVGRAGVVVCNEVMLPEVVSERVRAGATYLLNPSNDSWLQGSKYTGQQLDIARMRAIEQRRWLVRISTSGPSAVVDPFGRVEVATGAPARAVALGSVVPLEGSTLYGRIGDGFGLACLGAVAAATALSVRRGAWPSPTRSATR